MCAEAAGTVWSVPAAVGEFGAQGLEGAGGAQCAVGVAGLKQRLSVGGVFVGDVELRGEVASEARAGG